MTDNSPMTELAERARAVMPAGGFGNFEPGFFVKSGAGSRVIDENGKEYVDYMISSGPMILGHGHEEVNAAVREQLDIGMTFFANNAAGLELAEAICDAVPCAEQLRYVSTGGEADMYAMRLARAHTGRSKIMKFEGGYHGMSAEALMSLAPSRLQNFPRAVPDSAGIPESVGDGMLVAPFNDSDFAESLIDEHGDDIAGIIVEPLQRLIPPAPGFLETLRAKAVEHGIEGPSLFPGRHEVAVQRIKDSGMLPEGRSEGCAAGHLGFEAANEGFHGRVGEPFRNDSKGLHEGDAGALGRELDEERLVDPDALVLDVGLEEHARAGGRRAAERQLCCVDEPVAPARDVAVRELVEARQRRQDARVGRQRVRAQPRQRAAFVHDARAHGRSLRACSGWFCAMPW